MKKGKWLNVWKEVFSFENREIYCDCYLIWRLGFTRMSNWFNNSLLLFKFSFAVFMRNNCFSLCYNWNYCMVFDPGNDVWENIEWSRIDCKYSPDTRSRCQCCMWAATEWVPEISSFWASWIIVHWQLFRYSLHGGLWGWIQSSPLWVYRDSGREPCPCSQIPTSSCLNLKFYVHYNSCELFKNQSFYCSRTWQWGGMLKSFCF